MFCPGMPDNLLAPQRPSFPGQHNPDTSTKRGVAKLRAPNILIFNMASDANHLVCDRYQSHPRRAVFARPRPLAIPG
jgi:hypothetical protein